MVYPADPARAASTPELPAGLRVAGTGVRVRAWLIDTLLLFVASTGVFGSVLMATGIFSYDQQALFQMGLGKLPEVPIGTVNLFGFVLAEIGFVAITVAFAAWCWHSVRGTPGQKLLRLQVGDSNTGRNLSWRRSLARSLVLYGLPGVAGAVIDVVMSYLIAVASPSALVSGESMWVQGWAGVAILGLAAALFSVAVPAILLISVLGDDRRQGVHDRIAGSLVVDRAEAVRPPVNALHPAQLWPAPGNHPGRTGWSATYPPGPAWFGYPAPPVSIHPWQAASVPPPSYDPTPPARGDSVEPGESPDPDRPTPPPPIPPDRDADEVPRWQRPSLWFHDDDYDKAPRRSSISGMGRRAGAYVLDCVLVFMMFYLVLEVVGIAAQGVFSEKSSIIAGLIGGAEQAFYFIGGWLVSRGTLGQRILHLEVHNATTRKRLSFQDAFVRWAVLQGPFAAATIAPFGLNQVIAALAMAWALYLYYSTTTAKDGRGLHDRIANSTVSPDL
jgi:hypothetical protein